MIICGNETLSENEYATIQKAVVDYRQTCAPSTSTTQLIEFYYSSAIFQIKIESPTHVIVLMTFYRHVLGAGNIIELRKQNGR